MNIPCTFISGKRYAITKQPITIEGYVIPRSFRWDGASIPIVFQSLLFLSPYHPKVRRASLLHDYLCIRRPDIKRVYSDRKYRQLCREDGVNMAQAWAMYVALRAYAIITGR